MIVDLTHDEMMEMTKSVWRKFMKEEYGLQPKEKEEETIYQVITTIRADGSISSWACNSIDEFENRFISFLEKIREDLASD